MIQSHSYSVFSVVFGGIYFGILGFWGGFSQEAKAQQEEMILESQARLREGSSGQEELTRKQDELSRDFSKASRLRSQLQVEYESKVKALNENQLEMSQLKELMKRAEEQLMQDSQVISH